MHLLPKDLKFKDGGAKLCFLPWVPPNLVTLVRNASICKLTSEVVLINCLSVFSSSILSVSITKHLFL